MEENLDKQEQNKDEETFVDSHGVVRYKANGRIAPGNTANPNGRPKGMSLTETIKARLKELSPDNKRTALDWLADNIVQDALDSNNKMRQLIWNYLDGMPRQSLEVQGSEELPFVIKIVKDDRGTTTTGENN